ncbi:MAG: hypothetical protein ACP5R4_04265 [Armatimonadota bacterium]
MSLRHLKFLIRWVFFYNAELVWLSWMLPRRPSPEAALDPEADRRRRAAHEGLAEATGGCSAVCAKCGRCCMEPVSRFTQFDRLVRMRTHSPAPECGWRIYSLIWMLYNALRHCFQKLLSPYRLPKPCRYLTDSGCSLPRAERPMICVSWFCITAALGIEKDMLAETEKHLRTIEKLHRDVVCSSRPLFRRRKRLIREEH